MFIAIDGDATGKKLEKMILDNDLDELAKFSIGLQHKIQIISKYITDNHGRIIIAGGDNILAEIPSTLHRSVLNGVISLVDGKLSFSIAISETAQGAYLGLKYAKATGIRVIRAEGFGNAGLRFNHVHCEPTMSTHGCGKTHRMEY